MTLAAEFVIRSRRVLTPSGVRAASIRVNGGTVAEVADAEAAAAGRVYDFGDALVMAGLVDTHVHVNEPGRTEWEGFATATSAAAAGGVTTILDMPLNSIPATTSVAALEIKRHAAQAQCAVDVGFLGGVIPGNLNELEPLWRAGVFAFKCFLVPSGVDEFPAVTEDDLHAAFPVLARLGAPLMVHAELAQGLVAPAGDPRRYATYLATRPAQAETSAIDLVVRLARQHRAHVHIVHVSSAESVAVIARARADGVRITAETCPHYLTFEANEIPDGATEFKCAPPIRSAAHRDALWRGLADGVLDMIVSDHSPCTPALKHPESGDFFTAWGGIASLQLGLAAVWEGARARGISVERVAGWMSAAPAWLAGLERRKGAIAAGYDADIIAWDPEAVLRVRPEMIRHRHALTPYAGRSVHGVVRATFVGGRIAYIDTDTAAASTAAGRLLHRERA